MRKALSVFALSRRVDSVNYAAQKNYRLREGHDPPLQILSGILQREEKRTSNARPYWGVLFHRQDTLSDPPVGGPPKSRAYARLASETRLRAQSHRWRQGGLTASPKGRHCFSYTVGEGHDPPLQALGGV